MFPLRVCSISFYVLIFDAVSGKICRKDVRKKMRNKRLVWVEMYIIALGIGGAGESALPPGPFQVRRCCCRNGRTPGLRGLLRCLCSCAAVLYLLQCATVQAAGEDLILGLDAGAEKSRSRAAVVPSPLSCEISSTLEVSMSCTKSLMKLGSEKPALRPMHTRTTPHAPATEALPEPAGSSAAAPAFSVPLFPALPERTGKSAAAPDTAAALVPLPSETPRRLHTAGCMCRRRCAGLSAAAKLHELFSRAEMPSG